MAFQTFDPRFPSLTFHCLAFYWIVCLTTLGITVGSVVRQAGVYRRHCSVKNYYYQTSNKPSLYYSSNDSYPYDQDRSYETSCIPGDIVVFAIGLGVAIIGMIQSSLQLFLFSQRRISPLRLLSFNAVVTVLWIVVIAIGWDPTNWSYDSTTGIRTPNISGWLYTYSGNWATYSVSSGIGPTLALAMGFAVMSIISFGLAALLALYAFIVYHRIMRKQSAADNEIPAIGPNMNEKTGSGSKMKERETIVLQDHVSGAAEPIRSNHNIPELTRNSPGSRRSV